MNKNEFLKILRKKLSILEESEIDDIISEYDGYIEEKIAKGSTEEEAVSSMGDIDELVRELLSAYKVKNPDAKSKDSFNQLADNFFSVFERIIDIFAHKSFQEILRFVIEIVVIFIIIAICKLPFLLLEGMGREIFSSFGGRALSIFGSTWTFILEVTYLIFAVLLFIKIFESRYLLNKTSSKEEKIEKETLTKKNNKSSNESIQENEKFEDKKNHLGIIDFFVNVCMFFIKMIVFFILIGVIFYIVGMAITLGISFYFIIRGVFYFGIYLILFALFFLGIIAFIFMYNFIFNRKSKFGLLLIFSLVSFVILGLGVGVTAIEFAGTTIVYNEEVENPVKKEFTYDYLDHFVLGYPFFDERHIEFDDSLENQIKLVYSYDEAYFKIEAEPYTYQVSGYTVLEPWYHLKDFTYSKEYLNILIEALKNKTIHIYDNMGVQVKFFMSHDVYEKLTVNYKNYQKINHYRDDDLEDVCAYLYEYNYELPSYCRVYNYDV